VRRHAHTDIFVPVAPSNAADFKVSGTVTDIEEDTAKNASGNAVGGRLVAQSPAGRRLVR